MNSILTSHDNVTRTVTDYNESGAVTSTRPYTAEENTAADLAAEEAQAEIDRRALRATVKTIVLDLKAEKDRAQAVIDNPAATQIEKNLGRSTKRIADAAIDIARLVTE